MKLSFLDTETTGLFVGEHEVVQLTIIAEQDGKPIGIFNEHARPNYPERISEQALQKQNKTLEDLMAYQPREEFFEKLITFLDTHIDKYQKDDKFDIVGYNVKFDIDHIQKLFEEFDHKYYGSYFTYDPIDILPLVQLMRKTGVIETKNAKLETICEALGFPFEEGQAHDAIWDVRKCRQLFYKIEAAIDFNSALLM